MKNESISLEKTTKEEKRLVQYELLRVIAMFGVLMNHVFNYGLHIYDDFTLDVSSKTHHPGYQSSQWNGTSGANHH